MLMNLPLSYTADKIHSAEGLYLGCKCNSSCILLFLERDVIVYSVVLFLLTNLSETHLFLNGRWIILLHIPIGYMQLLKFGFTESIIYI